MHIQCGAEMPADVGVVTTHLAQCPHAGAELAAWCRAIVSAVSRAADIETPTVSPETPDETPRDTESMTPARMAELRDADMSLRDIAALADVSPETVRRRVARYRAGQVGVS